MQEMIRVNTGRLDKDSEKIRENIERMQSGLEKIKQHAASQDMMWEGEQADSFKDDFRMDLEILKTVMQNLEDIYSSEQAAKSKYESSEKQIENIVTQMQV